MSSSVAFIHGRPGPHPMHGRYAAAVGADFHFVDHAIRWHDRPSRRWRRYLSWVACAVTFPRRSQYRVFLSEGPHFPVVLLRWLRLIRRDQKVVALLGNETMYFLKSGRYKTSTALALRRLLGGYDALICLGTMTTKFAREVLGDRCPPVYTHFNGVPAERLLALRGVEPTLDGHEIVFVGNGPGGWKVTYKGLDLMLAAFRICAARNPGLRFTVVGDWDEPTRCDMLARNGLADSVGVRFVGPQQDLAVYLAAAALYLHCGRGDCCPLSLLEAMCAGLPSIVSDLTGNHDIVAEASSALVVAADADAIADRILWYFGLPAAERAALSSKCRQVIAGYTEPLAVEHFERTFRAMVDDLSPPGDATPRLALTGSPR
jgi:glycosyltransferase involved in cell wall biosynthesis